MSVVKSTPMVKQYLSIKEAYPDAILFYRMGDFYEMFFEDAEVASRVLEIALTSRNKSDEVPIPMCGVPCRAAQSYIARLIGKGHKVAICEQVEDPAQARGLVKREVVRVITPGMILENELLDAKSNNFILALTRDGDTAGLAHLDLSTGTFRTCESQDILAVSDEIRRVAPREILLPASGRTDAFYEALKPALGEAARSYVDDRNFDYRGARQGLLEQFGTLNLEGFGCENLRAAVGAAGALIGYLRETQKQEITHIDGIETYVLGACLQIDESSRRNLELERDLRSGGRRGTLLAVIDKTATAMGGRLLKHWLRYPLADRAAIEARLCAVEESLAAAGLRGQIRETLHDVQDLERIGSKVALGRGNARDLLALKRSLQQVPALQQLLARLQSGLFQMEEPLEPLQALVDGVESAVRDDAPPTVNEGGMIKEGYNPELDELVRISRDGKGWLAELEAREKQATGIGALKVSYNKVFGYYIEIPKSRSEGAPAHYVRKQTLVNAERYITDELKRFESRVIGAEERRATLEYELFDALRREVASRNRSIQRTARFLARVDCLMNLAEVAEQNGYCLPRMNTDGRIVIEDGRHPVVEKMITAERFVPNAVAMDNESQQVLIITGPNMAGKSTVLRQVALTVILAHLGSFVPARAASIGLTDRIFTRVGALDNLSSGQSTFMVEMQETANILNHATADSLVIMDEIGRGTSTFDGLSIAWAVAEHLHDLKGHGVKTLFATHYHELTELARTAPRVKNLNILVKEWNDEIIFLRKLADGSTNRSYGIQVARLAGVPGSVLNRAKKILAGIENAGRAFGAPPAGSAGRASSGPVPMQLELFRKQDSAVIERLRRLDVSHMTPVEALNCLNELQTQASAPPDRSGT